MGRKQAKYVNDSDANDASMLKDMPESEPQLSGQSSSMLERPTCSPEGTHDKVHGRLQFWTVFNYRA